MNKAKSKRREVRTPTCPYCGALARCVDSSVVYGGRSYGPIWLCGRYPICKAYVGCHKGTTVPLGRLADSELRIAKQKAHAAFDVLWKGLPSGTRKKAYAWLAEKMGLAIDKCHIGMFDVDQCEEVVRHCRERATP